MSDVRLIQLAVNIRPELKEDVNKDWVLNGKNNEFYDYIINMYNCSTTNSAINNSYINNIYGQGLYKKSGTTEDWIAFMTMIRPREIKKIVSDFQIFNEASFQCIKAKGKKELPTIAHLPKERVVPQIANEDEEIEGYFYSKNWKKQFKPENTPQYFKAFGTSKESTEIYVIKPYKVGKEYFSDPDYLAALPYAEMEGEIANLYISSVKNGLSAGYIVNIPDGNSLTPDEKDRLEKKMKERITGTSQASNFVINFQGRDQAITVEMFPVNDNIHKQWSYLTEEARQQILTGHLCTSSSLVGVSTASGFSSTADEMEEARKQLMVNVIQPKQDYIIEAFEDVATFYGLNLELGFKPLVEELQTTKTEMSAHIECSHEKKNPDLKAFLDLGEEEDLDTYDLIDEIEVDYDEEVALQLASTGVARPNANSSQDGDNFIVRYKYVGNISTDTRGFCSQMLAANKIYRKEDIIQLDNKVVNAGWGPNGANTYSIWLYKGGGSCHHKWNRVIYLKKGNKVDVNSPLAEIISTSEARRRGMKLETNDTLVSVEPRNMANEGFLKPR